MKRKITFLLLSFAFVINAQNTNPTDADGDGILNTNEGMCTTPTKTGTWTLNQQGWITSTTDSGVQVTIVSPDDALRKTKMEALDNSPFNTSDANYWEHNLMNQNALDIWFLWNRTPLTTGGLHHIENEGISGTRKFNIVFDKPVTEVYLNLDRFGGVATLNDAVTNSVKFTLLGTDFQMTKKTGNPQLIVTPNSFYREPHINYGSTANPSTDSIGADGTGAGTIAIVKKDGSTFTEIQFEIIGVGADLSGTITGDAFKLIVEACADLDTDKDGTPDYLDLDSDNDGCPDAKEGLPNSIDATKNACLSTDYQLEDGSQAPIDDVQGKYEFHSVGDVIKGTDGVDYEVIQVINPVDNTKVIKVKKVEVLDTDGDGVPNDKDLDSDNDGILDTNEGLCTDFKKTETWTNLDTNPTATTGSGVGVTIESPNDAEGKTEIVGYYDDALATSDADYWESGLKDQKALSVWYKWYKDNLPATETLYNNEDYTGLRKFKIKFDRPVSTVYFNIDRLGGTAQINDVDTGQPLTNEFSNSTKFTLQGTDFIMERKSGNPQFVVNGKSFYREPNIDLGNNQGAGSEAVGTRGTGAGTVKITKKDGTTFTELEFDMIGIGKKAAKATGDAFNIIIETCTNDDTDGDGIPNYLDLDSDGDGCPDAVEGSKAITPVNTELAGLAKGTLAGNAGITNITKTDVDAKGIPTKAGTTGQTAGSSADANIDACNKTTKFVDEDNKTVELQPLVKGADFVPTAEAPEVLEDTNKVKYYKSETTPTEENDVKTIFYTKEKQTKYVIDGTDTELKEVFKDKDFDNNPPVTLEKDGVTYVKKDSTDADGVRTVTYVKEKQTKYVIDGTDTELKEVFKDKDFDNNPPATLEKDGVTYVKKDSTDADGVRTVTYVKEKTTKFVDEDNKTVELKPLEKGKDFVPTAEAPEVLEDTNKVKYYKSETTPTEENDVKTIFYTKEKTTKWVTDNGVELKTPENSKDYKSGTPVLEDKEGNKYYIDETKTTEKDGVKTYVYTKEVTTEWVTKEDNTPLQPLEKGKTPKTAEDFEGYVLVDTQKDNNGNVKYIYEKPAPNVKVTRWLSDDKTPVVLKPVNEEATFSNENPEVLKDANGVKYYRKENNTEGNVKTYIYTKEKTTKWVTDNGVELKTPENSKDYKSGTPVLEDKEGNKYYIDETKTTEKDGVKTYVYTKRVINKVITEWVTEDGITLSPSEFGARNSKKIPDYKIVRTEIDEFGNFKHIYKKATISSCCDKVEVYNEFNPNSTYQANKFFFIENIDLPCYTNNTVEIFNRWGNTVWTGKGYDNNTVKFEGYSNGRAVIEKDHKLPVGTYFYMIDLGNGSKILKGWLYINR